MAEVAPSQKEAYILLQSSPLIKLKELSTQYKGPLFPLLLFLTPLINDV
jgi:hypothetical protein